MPARGRRSLWCSSRPLRCTPALRDCRLWRVKEQEFARRERRARVVRAWLASVPVDTIAVEQQLDAAAVRRILATTPGLRQERAWRDAEAEKQRVAHLRRQLIGWSTAHRGEPLTIAAERYDLTSQEVADLLGERARLHPSKRGGQARRYSDAEILQHVRDHILATGDHRADTYRDAARAYGWPSSAVVVSRFGSWRAALEQAGTPLPADTKPPRRRVITDGDLHVWLTRYFTEASSLSWNSMATWLHDHDGPSAKTIRARIGIWPQVVAFVRQPTQDR